MTMMRAARLSCSGWRKIGRGFFQFVSRVLHQFQTMGERGFRAFVVAAAKPCLLPKSDFQTTCFLFQAVCKTIFGRRRAGIQGALWVWAAMSSKTALSRTLRVSTWSHTNPCHASDALGA